MSGAYNIVTSKQMNDWNLTLFEIELTVYVWYHGNMTKLFNFNRTLWDNKNNINTQQQQQITLVAQIDGPSLINGPNSNGNSIQSESLVFSPNFKIVSNLSCLISTDHNITAKWLNMQGHWCVNESTGTVNLSRFNKFLEENVSQYNYTSGNDNTHTDLIILMQDVYNMIVPGYYYDFELNVECNYGDIGCVFVTTRHTLYYQESDLVCQIAGGNEKRIRNVSWTDIFTTFGTNIHDNNNNKFLLDGNTFTFDRQSLDIQNKSHLHFDWDCIVNDEIKCNDAIEPVSNEDNSIVFIDFYKIGLFLNETIMNTEFKNTIFLVIDLSVTSNTTANSHLFRETVYKRSCHTQQRIVMQIVPNMSQSQGATWLDVSLTAVKPIINRNDRLRLIGTINNYYGHEVNEFIFKYSELNGYLNESEIDNRVQDLHNNDNTVNLVLDGSFLTPGLTYKFGLYVYYHLDLNTSIGEANVDITVLEEESVVIDGSFAIEPSCENLQLNSINELFNLGFEFSVNTYDEFKDGSKTLVNYQFVLQFLDQSITLLHSSFLSNPYLNDVILPIGIYWIKIVVFDNYNGVLTSSLLTLCNISLNQTHNSNTIANEYKFNISDTLTYINSNYLSTHLVGLSKHIYVLQYLQALLVMIESNNKWYYSCAELSTPMVEFLFDYFGSESEDLCQTNEVSHVAQVLTLYFEYCGVAVADTQNGRFMSLVYDLLIQILDPCRIYNRIDRNEMQSYENGLSVEVESVLTQHKRIYFYDDEVTSDISNIILLQYFSFIFLDLIEYSTEYFDLIAIYNHNSTIIVNKYNILCRNSLYTFTLLELSESITCETFIREKYDNFAASGTRAPANQTINHELTLNDNEAMVIHLENQRILEKGRNSFTSLGESFDSIDCVAITLNTTLKFEKDDAYRVVQPTLVHILSNNTQDYQTDRFNLDKNLSMVFSIDNFGIDSSIETLSNVVFDCVWYNGSDNVYDDDQAGVSYSLWSNAGCVAVVDQPSNSVNCECNHLTAFGILWYLDEVQQNDESDFFDQYANNPYFTITLSLLCGGFTVITFYIVRLLYILRIRHEIPILMCCNHGKKHQLCEPAFAILFFSLIQSMTQMFSCTLFLVFVVLFPDNNFDNYGDSQAIYHFFQEFLTFGLFLPMISSFYIYTSVIYGLNIVSNSLAPRIETIRKQSFHCAVCSNVLITIILTIICAFFVFDLDHLLNSQIFVVFESIYLLLLLIVLILTNYYTFGAYQTIQTTLNVIKSTTNNAENGQNDHDAFVKHKKAANRILLSSFVLSLVLIVEMILLTIFMINVKLYSPIMQIVGILTHLVYLMFVLYFYKNYFKTKIASRIEQS